MITYSSGGATATIDFDNGGTITLNNLEAPLTASDFVF